LHQFCTSFAPEFPPQFDTTASLRERNSKAFLDSPQIRPQNSPGNRNFASEMPLKDKDSGRVIQSLQTFAEGGNQQPVSIPYSQEI
jgi:hypothetical protein